MTFPLAPFARQHLAARWLMPAAALVIGVAFAGFAHAQEDQAPSRAVASVETQLSSAAPGGLDVDSAPTADAAALPAPDLAQNQAQPQPRKIRRIDIGSATQALWDMQRASPGVLPRPIDGEQASRSYQRYLKSFETTIPEHYGSGLNLKKQ